MGTGTPLPYGIQGVEGGTENERCLLAGGVGEGNMVGHLVVNAWASAVAAAGASLMACQLLLICHLALAFAQGVMLVVLGGTDYIEVHQTAAYSRNTVMQCYEVDYQYKWLQVLVGMAS